MSLKSLKYIRIPYSHSVKNGLPPIERQTSIKDCQDNIASTHRNDPFFNLEHFESRAKSYSQKILQVPVKNRKSRLLGSFQQESKKRPSTSIFHPNPKTKLYSVKSKLNTLRRSVDCFALQGNSSKIKRLDSDLPVNYIQQHIRERQRPKPEPSINLSVQITTYGDESPNRKTLSRRRTRAFKKSSHTRFSQETINLIQEHSIFERQRHQEEIDQLLSPYSLVRRNSNFNLLVLKTNDRYASNSPSMFSSKQQASNLTLAEFEKRRSHLVDSKKDIGSPKGPKKEKSSEKSIKSIYVAKPKLFKKSYPFIKPKEFLEQKRPFLESKIGKKLESICSWKFQFSPQKGNYNRSGETQQC